MLEGRSQKSEVGIRNQMSEVESRKSEIRSWKWDGWEFLSFAFVGTIYLLLTES